MGSWRSPRLVGSTGNERTLQTETDLYRLPDALAQLLPQLLPLLLLAAETDEKLGVRAASELVEE